MQEAKHYEKKIWIWLAGIDFGNFACHTWHLLYDQSKYCFDRNCHCLWHSAIVIGISDIMMYVRVERYTGFGPMVSLIGGILSVMSGVMLFVYPNAGKWVLSLLFPIWFIAHYISRLAHLSSMRIYMENFAYYLTLILNILGLISGFMMIFHPFVSLLSVSYIIGLHLILLGIDCIVIAFSKISSNH